MTQNTVLQSKIQIMLQSPPIILFTHINGTNHVICSYTACAASFSFFIYLPYLRRALVTSQIICDVTCTTMLKNNQPARIYRSSNQVLAGSSVTRLRGKRGEPNYNRFFPEPTYNFLDHPSNQEVGPRGSNITARYQQRALYHEKL